MRTLSATIAALAMTAAAFSLPAVAQTSDQTQPPAAMSPSGSSEMNKAPATPPAAAVQPRAENGKPDGDAMQNSTAAMPDAGVTTAHRASRIIGMDVVNDKDQTIGKVDDILIGPGDKATSAVVSVGGFLGIGSKLVAVPFDQLQPAANDPKSLTMPNASKEQLKSMPEFQYGKGA